MRRMYPYRLPEAGGPARVAFVGHHALFSPAAVHHATPALVPRFFDTRDGDWDRVLAELEAFRPHAVVAFRPQEIPAGALAQRDCAVLGVAPEPLPRADLPWHEGLLWNLAQLERTDPANVDRVMVCDPRSMDAVASRLPAWRAFPLPVDDRVFAPVRPAGSPPRALFIGYSTLRVEHWLLPVKHNHDVAHYAWGLTDELLAETLATVDIGIHVHDDDGLEHLPHRVLLHLAVGHLLLSERFAPGFALEPDIDFLVIDDPYVLDLRLHQLAGRPDAYDRIRIRGRDKAEQYRASTAWAAIVADLFDDLAAFGAQRA